MEAADVAPEVVRLEHAKPSVTLVAQMVTFILEALWLGLWAGRGLVEDVIPAAAKLVAGRAAENCMSMSGSMSRQRLITVDAESVSIVADSLSDRCWHCYGAKNIAAAVRLAVTADST
jgi:hypothetical protein